MAKMKIEMPGDELPPPPESDKLSNGLHMEIDSPLVDEVETHVDVGIPEAGRWKLFDDGWHWVGKPQREG